MMAPLQAWLARWSCKALGSLLVEFSSKEEATSRSRARQSSTCLTRSVERKQWGMWERTREDEERIFQVTTSDLALSVKSW